MEKITNKNEIKNFLNQSNVEKCRLVRYTKKGESVELILTKTVFDPNYPVLGYIENNILYKITPNEWSPKKGTGVKDYYFSLSKEK